MGVGERTRLGSLLIGTGLVAAYVRHGIEYNWRSWESWEQLFVSWFIHTVAVLLLVAFAGAAIHWQHKFFLGYEPGKTQDTDELIFHVLMTVLIACIGIALTANYVPGD